MKLAPSFCVLALPLALASSACAPTTPELDPPPDSSEQQISGPVLVRVHDGGATSTAQFRLALPSGQRVTLRFDTPTDLRRGDLIEVTGFLHPNGTFDVTSLDAREAGPVRLDTPMPRISTRHRVAIVAFDETETTEQEALDAIDQGDRSVKALMAAASGGTDTFSADVFRRYDVPTSDSDCALNNTSRLADKAIGALRSDGVDPSQYEHVIVIVPQSCGDWTGSWSELGGVKSDGSLDFARLSMFKDDAFDAWSAAHALGHNLGLEHATSISCTGPLADVDDSTCVFEEFGDHNDIMGSGEGVFFNTPNQRYLGWLHAKQVVTTSASGTFNLQPADDETCGIRALRIAMPGTRGSYIYVEYRRARESSPYAGTGTFGDRSNAVLITRAVDGGDGSSAQTARVELDEGRFQGAKLDTRYDLGSGVFITVRSLTGATARVEVEAPGQGTPLDDAGDASFSDDGGIYGRVQCDDAPVDECPDDPTKETPGECGCGVPEGTCGNQAYLEMRKSTYAVGEDVEVNFYNLPGNFYDWVGLYRPGVANESYQTFTYTQGVSTGTMVFPGRSTPGTYEARLFFNDSYDLEATVTFTVE